MAKDMATLTPRQRDIITILAQFSTDAPATVADISKELNISSRTVLRELPTIEQWLQGQQVEFIRKPGVGIALVGSAQERQEVVGQLQAPHKQELKDKPTRRRLLLAGLLSDQEPVKSYALSKTHQISDGTLAADLDSIQRWLAAYDVDLHRKPGLGIYISGGEKQLRQAMVGLVYEWMQDGMVSSWFLWGNATGDSQQTQGLYALGLLQQSGDLPALRDLLTQSGQAHGRQFTDHGFLATVVQLSVAITRMRQGCYLDQETPMPASQQALGQDIANKIAQTFALTVPDAECAAIGVGLMDALVENSQSQEPWDEIALRRGVLALVELMEQEIDMPLRQDTLLISDLTCHLQNTKHRLQLGLKTNHAHSQEIQKAYPDIYKATAQGCKQLEPIFDAQSLDDNEIALIAMHFCAAVERGQKNQRPMQVVVTCPMGMGTSRILMANVEKQFPDIAVKGVVSTMTLDPKWLKQQAIDLVISTVMLDIDYPYVCVSPVLNPQDMRRLQTFVKQWTPPASQSPIVHHSSSALLDTLAYVQDLSQELSIVLTALPLSILDKAESKDQLLRQGAQLFAPHGDPERILTDLIAREAISETYIDQGHTLLLHCKTSGVDHCHLGYIRLQQSLDNQGNQVWGAIMMVAPLDARKVHIEMMGHICSAFLDNQALNQAVQTGTQQDFAYQVERVLGAFYKKTLQLL